jgi:hypothetical protein
MAEENEVRKTTGQPKPNSQSTKDDSARKEKLGKEAVDERVLAEELLRLVRAL